jgi:hypothetical protein
LATALVAGSHSPGSIPSFLGVGGHQCRHVGPKAHSLRSASGSLASAAESRTLAMTASVCQIESNRALARPNLTSFVTTSKSARSHSGAVADVRDSAGPVQITRYNMFPAAAINGASLPGVSTGDVLATMEKLAQALPRNLQQQQADLYTGGQTEEQRKAMQ